MNVNTAINGKKAGLTDCDQNGEPKWSPSRRNKKRPEGERGVPCVRERESDTRTVAGKDDDTEGATGIASHGRDGGWE